MVFVVGENGVNKPSFSAVPRGCKESVLVQVGMPPPPGKSSITAENLKTSTQEVAVNNLRNALSSLDQCNEIRPKNYSQTIPNRAPSVSGVIYVWEIAVKKESDAAVVLRLVSLPPPYTIPQFRLLF